MWADGDGEASEEAISEVRVHLDCIFVEFQVQFLDGFARWLAEDGWDVLVREVVRDFGGIGGHASALA